MGSIARGIAAATLLGAAAAILAACSSDVLRPDIDVTPTAALVAPAPVATVPAEPLSEPFEQAVAEPAMTAPDMTDPDMTDPDMTQPAMTEPSMTDPDVTQPAPVYAAQVPASSMSVLPPPPLDDTEEPRVIQAAITPGPGLQRLVPNNPYMNQEPEYRDRNAVPGAMPQSEADCRRELKRIGATYQDLPPIGDGNYCGIDYPVKLAQLSGGIAIKPAATLSCQMALQVAKWTKHELGPSTRRRYFTGVKAIHQASSYSCRKIRGSRTMSEHSKGNALDIMRIELDSGKKIGVRKPGFFAFREKGLLNNVRADACGYFSTVLGPGYDRDHKDHFHFDIAKRRNGHKACR